MALSACVLHPPRDWRDYDILRDTPPAPPPAVGGVPVDEADYRRILGWGERWFRSGAQATERSATDLAGMMLGTVEVPAADAPGGYRPEPVLTYYVQALDALDGQPGNLFVGNGGGFTNDLTLRFPPGARLHGAIPLPAEVHTGLDVDAGAPWPIGLGAVPAVGADADLPYLPEPSALGAGPAEPGRVRFRLSCAACHYSLDVDFDGVPDLHSTLPGQPTEGSPYAPEDSWGIGNQDLAIGWIVALSANPILLSTVFSGPIGPKDVDEAPTAWIEWVQATYRTDPTAVLREVVAGAILQPRGYADVMADARFNTNQFPNLYTWHNWPSNIDGALPNARDRNNIVWTSTLDFAGLVGTCAQRAGSVKIPWERPAVNEALDCDTFADMMARYSLAGRADPASIPRLVDDILGRSDGVPGITDPDEQRVILGSPAMPKEIFAHPDNVAGHRQTSAAELGGDAPLRGGQLALLGTRIRTPDAIAAEIGLDALVARYPGLDRDEFVSDAVNALLDWMRPPPNVSPLLASARGQVERGRRVFEASGCDGCHRGPFGTDNQLHPVSTDADTQFGLPRAPTTSGWRVLDRGVGEAVGTDPQRMWDSRTIRRLLSPPYDPATGEVYRKGGPLQGLLSAQPVGYKASILLNLWNSAPFLHDGGVGVALAPGATPAGDSLPALLRRAGGPDVLYGMGAILSEREKHVSTGPFPSAALSLQALLLASEREKVLAGNRAPVVPVPVGTQYRPNEGEPPATHVSMAQLGVLGAGHPFWVEDEPGGESITAIVAYLLALDDCPRDLPGDPAPKPCTW